MTLEIPLAAADEQLLRERAAASGKNVETFVRETLLEKLEHPTFAELLEPVHGATRSRGLGLEEIDELADRARNEYWAEQKSQTIPET